MGLQVLGGDLHAGLHQRDLLTNDHGIIDVPQLHSDEVEDADPSSGQQALHPEPDEPEQQQDHDEADDDDDGADDQEHRRLIPGAGGAITGNDGYLGVPELGQQGREHFGTFRPDQGRTRRPVYSDR